MHISLKNGNSPLKKNLETIEWSKQLLLMRFTMMKKAFFIGLVGIAVLSPFFCSANSASQQDWKEVKSCIDLSNQLKKLIADPHFDPTITTFPKTETRLIDDGQLSFSSSTFFTDYNEKKQLLTIIKWPKDAKNTLIDFNKAKKTAKFQLPKDFQELEVLFFKEEMLILSANRFPKGEHPETVVLFYEIKNDKLSPIHFFRQSGKKIKWELINEKLYLITETPFSKAQAQSLIKKDGDLPSIFPKTSEGLSYGLKFSDEKQARCQDFKYLFSPQAKMPQMWSIVVSDLNNLQAAKERFYLLGNFTNFQFSKDFLYASSERGSGQSLAQRFALEPKINYQKAELLHGKSLQNSILTEKTKSAFITERKSWKLNSYLLTPFDERFIAQKSVELFSGNESYSSAQLLGNHLLLSNQQQFALLAEQLEHRNFQRKEPITLAEKEQYFFLKSAPLSLIELKNEGNQILLSFKQENPQNKQLVEQDRISISESKLIGSPSWDSLQNLLILPLQSQQNGKTTQELRGFKLSDAKKITPQFRRKYPNGTQAFEKILQLPHFSYALSTQLIDLFLADKPQNMKLLKRN